MRELLMIDLYSAFAPALAARALGLGSDPRVFLSAVSAALSVEAKQRKGEDRKVLVALAKNLGGLTSESVRREAAGGRPW